MKKKVTFLQFGILLLFPILLQSQAIRNIDYSVLDVYTDPSIVDGEVIQVVGYYTNPDYDLLIDFYGDFIKDQPFLPHTVLKLTGVQPPADALNGGYIRVVGTISFIDIPDPYNPADSLMAYLDATSVTVIIPAGIVPGAPGGIKKVQKKAESGGNRDINSGDCDPCKFAFLLSGGVDSLNNHSKYWENLVALYNFKVDSLGYCDSNVFVLYFKGDARDGRIPAGRVVMADSTNIDSVFAVIASRVAACTANNTPATFQKMVTNHGASNGDICLLGDNVITPEHLKDEQQRVIDSCCRTVYDEFIECYGGHVVDAVSTLDEMSKATIYANSNANDQPGYSPHDAVHPYLQEKINALDSGKSYPDAVVRAKLAYDEYLEGLLAEIHNYLDYLRAHDTIPDRDQQVTDWVADSTDIANAICKSRNVTIVPFTHYCQWRKFVVPPSGQLVIDFSGGSNSCGNATVYRENPVTGEKIKVSVWNWNHPGSFGYIPGNEKRVINADFTDITTFWIHNDNDTSRLKVQALGSVVFPVSPANIFTYPGFSFGGTDNSSSEFLPLPGPSVFIESIDQLNLSLHSLPAILGPGFVSNFGFSFNIDPTNAFWSDMVLILNVRAVNIPGILMIQSPSGSIPFASVNINSPGEYVVPLGNFTLGGTNGIISMVPQPGLQMEFDSWGFRSQLRELPPQNTVWTGNSSSNWTDPLNWSNGVPGIFHNVTIMPGLHQPFITSNVIIKSILISEGANVITAPGVSLMVTGQ
jgi:hypothetical protein